MVVMALGAEYTLRKLRPGWQLRAQGSDEESARRIGLHTNRIFILGYVGIALFTALGAVMLMAQIGVGDPSQGVNYTLASITAVGPWRHQSERQPWHVHRLDAWRTVADRSAKHRLVLGPVTDVPIHLPGSSDPDCGSDLFGSARSQRKLIGPNSSGVMRCLSRVSYRHL